jgi:hypothetical protein
MIVLAGVLGGGSFRTNLEGTRGAFNGFWGCPLCDFQKAGDLDFTTIWRDSGSEKPHPRFGDDGAPATSKPLKGGPPDIGFAVSLLS